MILEFNQYFKNIFIDFENFHHNLHVLFVYFLIYLNSNRKRLIILQYIILIE